MDILKILKEVNVHSLDDGEKFLCTERRDRIIGLLKSSSWKKIVDDGFLLLYANFSFEAKQNLKNYVLVSCHIDTVFDENDYFVEEIGEGEIKGTLDNSASIAILLKSMLDNSFKKGVLVSFTGDEERGMAGVKKTMIFLKNNLREIFDSLTTVITLDITLDNYDKSVSIENLFFNRKISNLPQIRDRKDFENFVFEFFDKNRIDFGYVPHEYAAPDESWEYDEFGINAFSICIPTFGDDCHSLNGVSTTLSKLNAVERSLIGIVNEFLG